MDFLVRIAVTLPPELPVERVERLVAAERARGAELKADGTIQRIWRIPGGMQNVGIWSAADATALHDALMSLPLARYMKAEVTPLAVHPLE
jgi:muconolactone D-isomerase